MRRDPFLAASQAIIPRGACATEALSRFDSGNRPRRRSRPRFDLNLVFEAESDDEDEDESALGNFRTRSKQVSPTL